MLLSVLQGLSTNILYFILHLSTNSSFPKPLTAKEEQEEFIKFHENGDIDARNRLVNHNMRLVAHIIKKYYAGVSDQDDIISIGTIGLIKAINTFDYTKGTRLATYASRCIENEILMYLRKISSQKMEISLDEPLNTDWDGNELMLADVLGSEVDEISREIEEDDEIRLLLEIVNKLPQREKEIIDLRFGLGDKEELTQKQVADKLGISQSYISRLEKRILKRIGDRMLTSK